MLEKSERMGPLGKQQKGKKAGSMAEDLGHVIGTAHCAD
jgi:hypothetical protein